MTSDQSNWVAASDGVIGGSLRVTATLECEGREGPGVQRPEGRVFQEFLCKKQKRQAGASL